MNEAATLPALAHLLPSSPCSLTSTGLDQHLLGVLALRAIEGPQIRTAGALFDLSQHHAALTVGATSFNGKQRWVGMIGSKHVMPPSVKAGAQHSQS